MTQNSTDVTRRLSWPLRVENDQPIVRWACCNCGEEVEHAYQPSLLKRCPSCGGNPEGVRRFEVEPFVKHQRRRLQRLLAERYGLARFDSEAPCAECGTTDDVHIDPGLDLDDFQYRCDECRRFPYQFWWQAGDHPGLLTREWIETCDECGAEFTGIFGVSYRPHSRGKETAESTDYCLQCVDVDWLVDRLQADEERYKDD